MRTTPNTNTDEKNGNHRWGIILAGGDGRRLHDFIITKFGLYRPKQYCAMIGKRTLLRHTIDRVSSLFDSNQLLTTINAQHRAWAQDDLRDRNPKTVIIQPYNRETGPGILLPLIHIHHDDPLAVVALFPSDHLIIEEERFRGHVKRAFEFVEKHPEHLLTLGVPPKGCRDGYGWITKGNRLGAEDIYRVKSFCEKPDSETAHDNLEKGSLWNTMILIGTSRKFMELLEAYMNDIFVPLQTIELSLGTSIESVVTEDVFKRIPAVNFSRNILERIPHHLSVLQMNDVYWNDWGDESRILDDCEVLEQLVAETAGHRHSEFDGMIV